MYSCLVEQYCTSYWTDTINATSVGLATLSSLNKQFSVTACTRNSLSILFNQSVQSATIELFNLSGQLIWSTRSSNLQEGQRESFDMNVGAGSYILNVVGAYGVKSYQLLSIE